MKYSEQHFLSIEKDIPRETKHPDFQEGDLIICPSDLTSIKWRIVHVGPKRNYFAQVAEGQVYPSTNYPEEIEITHRAAKKWKKVQ